MNVNKVKSDFQLLACRVSNIKVDNDLFMYSTLAEAKRGIDVAYRIISAGLSDDGQFLEGVLELNLKIIISIEDKNMVMEFSNHGVFSANKDMLIDDFKKMLSLNGCSALYSITRAKVSGITSQIFEDGCVTLPMVNFVKFRKVISKE